MSRSFKLREILLIVQTRLTELSFEHETIFNKMLTIKRSMTDTKDLLSKICEQISGDVDEVVDLGENDHQEQKINFIQSKQFATKNEFELWLKHSLPDNILMDELKSVFPEWIPIRNFLAAKETEKSFMEGITVDDSVNNDDFLSPSKSSVKFNSRADEDKHRELYFAIINGSSTLRKNRNTTVIESSDSDDNQIQVAMDPDHKMVAAKDSARTKDNPYRLKMLSFIGKMWAKLNFDNEYDTVAGKTFTDVQDLLAFHVQSFMTVNTTSIELEIPIQYVRDDETYEAKEIRFPTPAGIRFPIFIFLIIHCLLYLDFAAWNRETIRNRIKSLRAAAAKAKAKATSDNNKDKKKKKKRTREEIVQKEEGRSSKLNNNMLKTELHDDGNTPSEKEFLGNDAFLYGNGDFFGINDLSYTFLGHSALNEGK